MENKLVSVIMSAYNAEKFIEKSIVSIVWQSYKPIEIVICDDGSTDNTASVIKKYGDSVRYIYQQNQGQGIGRNNAVTHSSGEYLAFIDADDQWLPKKIEKQIEIFNNYPDTTAVYCDMQIINQKNETIGYQAKGKMRRGYIFDYLVRGNYVCGLSSLIVKREPFNNVGGFSDHRYCQDFVLLLKLAYDHLFNYCEEPLVLYLSHGDNITNNLDISFPETIGVYHNLHNTFQLSEEQILLSQKQLKRLYHSYAILHMRRNNFIKAKHILNEAEQYNLLFWKSRVLKLLNVTPINRFIYYFI